MEGVNVVGVQFRRAGKIYDFFAKHHDLIIGDQVIVNTEKGTALATIVQIGFLGSLEQAPRKLQPIVRRVNEKDLERKYRLDEEQVTQFTKDKVDSLKLNMRILKSEIQYGGTKITVYFVAPNRVDFRELVKELASGLKARVELKQVGARDETKLLGGIGICGREYCCSSFLREFIPVSIKMAKNQNLALNPTKVSGGCGRLLCCLTYENKAYSSLRKRMPPLGSSVRLKDSGQSGTVERADLLNQEVLIRTNDGGELNVKLDAVEILKKGQRSGGDDFEDSWGEDLDLEELMEEVKPQSNSNNSNRGPRKPRGPR